MTAQLGALLDAQTMWYVTRATGVVSLVLLTASVVLGVTEAVRWMSDRWPRFVTAGIHKNVSLLATTFIGAHIVTAIVDGFAPIGVLDTVVPFRSAYRPVWLGLGTVAFDLLVAIAVTSVLRRRIGRRVWRLVHWAAYACWPVALVHGLGTGTDTKTTWLLAVELACMAAVVAAVWWRVVAAGWPVDNGRRVLAAGVTTVAPLVIAAWLFAGPLQPGWARRAGTPSSLLGAGATSAGTAGDATGAGGAPPTASAATSAATVLPTPFDASLNGTLTDPGPDPNGRETITIEAQLDGGATGSVKLVLSGRALEEGGVSLDTSNVTLTSGNDTYSGSVTGLRGDVVDVDLRSSTGSSLLVELDLVLSGDSVTGTAHGSAG